VKNLQIFVRPGVSEESRVWHKKHFVCRYGILTAANALPKLDKQLLAQAILEGIFDEST
jgi:hypothetical protein